MTGPGWVRPMAGDAGDLPAGRPLLLCLAYAGRGASVFHRWPALLGDAAQVCAVQMPGREDRQDDRLVTELPSFLDRVLADLELRLDEPGPPRPVVVFGHCLGAQLAAELALELARRGRHRLAALVLSGSAPPWLQEPLPDDLGTLTDAQFVRGLRQVGALTARQIAEPAVLAMTLPALRADYLLSDAARRHRQRPSTPPLSCPLVLLAGADDVAIEPEQVRDWSALSSEPAQLTVVPGDHFFLESATPAVVAAVRAVLPR